MPKKDKYTFYLGLKDKNNNDVSKNDVKDFLQSEKFPLNSLSIKENNGLYKGNPEKSLEIVYIDIMNLYSNSEISKMGKILKNEFNQEEILIEKNQIQVI